MSEEEKEAIKVLKDLLEEFEDVEKWVIVNFSKKEFESLRICVNLIEKQQKEIEEKTTILFAGAKKVKSLENKIEKEKQYTDFYKNLCDRQQKEIEEFKKYVKTKLFPKFIRNSLYISKDKIREKLEYQYILWNTPNRQTEYSQDVVDILEELLEE